MRTIKIANSAELQALLIAYENGPEQQEPIRVEIDGVDFSASCLQKVPVVALSVRNCQGAWEQGLPSSVLHLTVENCADFRGDCPHVNSMRIYNCTSFNHESVPEGVGLIFVNDRLVRMNIRTKRRIHP